jgi:phosphatidylglycerophosphate synthase
MGEHIRVSVASIKRVGQPASITGRRSAEHWTASLYLRKLSPYVTWALLPTGISANGVTLLMIVVGWSSAAALLLPGLPGAVLAAALAQAQMLVDASDGEVARVRGTSGALGVFLDKVGHYTTEALIPIALGFRAGGDLSVTGPWPFLGAVLGVILLWNKSLNEMVDSTRYATGLDKLPDTHENVAPRGGLLALARRAVRFFPFHRIYHSVEMTLLILAAAVGDALLGDLAGTRFLLAALVPLAALSTLGHAVAIVSSRRLR